MESINRSPSNEKDHEAIDNVPEEEQSPVEQVALTVSTTDDPSLPVWTFRMWTLGLFSCVLLSFLNQFFAYRTAPLVITQITVQVAALPLGRLMASMLPKTKFRLPGTRKMFSLNPGPFNMKEHVLITIFGNSGSAFGNGPAYAVGVVNIVKAFYHRNISFAAGLLIIISTQVLGYGWAGLFRKYLIEPAHMWWPSTLVQVMLFRTLHEKDKSKGLSRSKFFLVFVLASFAYYTLPGFLFATTLISISWVCWAFPKSITMQQLGSGRSGLGLGAVSLDWATTSAFLLSPLVAPFFAIANVAAGFVLIIYIFLPAAYWSNVFNAKRFPIYSSRLFTSTGKFYDVQSILNDNFQLNTTAYEQQGQVHLSVLFAFSYGFGFATIAATVTHVLCFYGKEIWQRSRASLNTRPDVHTQLMRVYPDIPKHWWHILLIVTVGLAIGVCEGFKKQLQLPWWGLLLACVLALGFTLPVGVITATTNQTPGLNIITEYIMGYILPGRPLANVCFKVYGYMSMSQAVSFLADFKLGHYMKVPPRSMFMVQVIGTIVAGTVNMGVAWWLLNSINDICSPSLPPNSPWTCPNDAVFFDASVIWGLVGPKRIFGSEGRYSALNWFFLVGAILPVILWMIYKVFPRLWWIPYINMPVLLGALSNLPPATTVNYVSWIVVGTIFNYFVFKYRKAWWKRYNYVLSAALDAGVAFMGVFLYLALQVENVGIDWWGTQGEHCPLAKCQLEPTLVCPS